MARINIEDCWWSDPRRTSLILSIGFEADSAAVNMWRAAQEFWGKSRGLVPWEVFEKIKHADALISSGLAVVRDSFVYVRGSSAYLDWHYERREQAREAGKKSAESRRKKSGSAQPKAAKNAKKPERISNEPRTKGNDTEPSDSGSLSLSFSGSSSRNSVPTERAPSAADVIGFYYKTWGEVHNAKPPRKGSNHGILDRLVRENGVDRTKLLLEAYFAMPDPWVKKTAHDLQVFASKLNEVAKFADSGHFVTMTAVRKADEDVHHRQENIKAFERLPDEKQQDYLDCFEDTPSKAIGGQS